MGVLEDIRDSMIILVESLFTSLSFQKQEEREVQNEWKELSSDDMTPPSDDIIDIMFIIFI